MIEVVGSLVSYFQPAQTAVVAEHGLNGQPAAPAPDVDLGRIVQRRLGPTEHATRTAHALMTELHAPTYRTNDIDQRHAIRRP